MQLWAGIVKDITLRNLTVSDVNDVFSKNKGGGTGIRWDTQSTGKKSRFDGLLIVNCHLIRCDRDGIKGGMNPWHEMSFLSTNVVIRNNLIEDVGGDGIVITGADGAVVEFNRVYGARQRVDLSTREAINYAGPSVGIWPWSSNHTQIHCNEVWNYAGTCDGQGFDSDWNGKGTLFEYNLSAENEGGFFLICNWSKQQDLDVQGQAGAIA